MSRSEFRRYLGVFLTRQVNFFISRIIQVLVNIVFYKVFYFLIRIQASIKGLIVLNRNKNMHLIIFLCIFLLIILVVNVILHIRIHIVYSSGVGPFIIIGLIILAIVVLYFKR